MAQLFVLVTIIATLFCAQTTLAESEVSWVLEDYNNWNLPFAKTLEMQSVEGGDHYHFLAANTYKMVVDPSALFTVLFLEPDNIEQPDTLINLDYNAFGETSLVEGLQGFWVDVKVSIPHDIQDYKQKHDPTHKWFFAEITIFVALGSSPQRGLDGTLSVAVMPNLGDWSKTSFMTQLEETYEFQTIYISFYFFTKEGLHAGEISFADEQDTVDSMTFGGSMIIQDQLDSSGDLFSQPLVSMYLNINMTQISFDSVLLQENQIFVTEFAQSISLTPSIAATHMPLSIYNYFDNQFIQYTCTEQNDGNETAIAVPLSSCQCNGDDYFGMPNIDYVLNVDMYETGYSYSMLPHQYEMSPKVNTEMRGQQCNLGLWNIAVVTNATSSLQGSNQFALGQNFIRKYNLTIRFTERDDSTDNISLSVFIGKTSEKISVFTQLVMALGTGFFLLAYLGYFTVLKFRRVKREKLEFKEVQKGAQNISASEARRMLNAQQREADFIKGKADAQTINHMKVVTANQILNRNSQQRGNDILPMRSSKEFAQMRTRSFSVAIKRTAPTTSSSNNENLSLL